MSLYLESSALLAAVTETPGRERIVRQLLEDNEWYSSAISAVEVAALIPRVAEETAVRSVIRRNIDQIWDRVAIIPLDNLCLLAAAELSSEFALHVNHAIHFAACQRVPRPVRFLTSDSAIISAAADQQWEVVSP